MLTVPTQFPALAVTLIILVPNPAFPPKRDLDAQHSQERLRPSQPAGERARVFCP
jgi:hypothetical protein